MNKPFKTILIFILCSIIVFSFFVCKPTNDDGGDSVDGGDSGDSGDGGNDDPPNITVTEVTTGWNKMFDGDNGTDIANSVDVDKSDGSIYVVGVRRNSSGSNTYDDWWIKKFDSDGNEDITNWNKIINASASGYDVAQTVAIDSNGEVYIGGYGENLDNGSSDYDWWIKKFDSNGNEDTGWNKAYDGNGGVDKVFSIAIDSQGNVYAVGTGQNIAGSTTVYDWWIKKFDSNGNEDTGWNKQINGTGNVNSWDIAYDVAIDNQDNVYVVGYAQDLVDSNSDEDWWIKKFDSNGTEDTANWNKAYDGSGGGWRDRAHSIAIDSEDNVYIAGYGTDLTETASIEDWWIKKFDSDGNELWQKQIDNVKDEVNSLTIDDNDIIYVAGYGTQLAGGSTWEDWWIKAYYKDGTELWDTSFDHDSRADEAMSVAVDGTGNVYVAGYGSYLVDSFSSMEDWWIKKYEVTIND